MGEEGSRYLYIKSVLLMWHLTTSTQQIQTIYDHWEPFCCTSLVVPRGEVLHSYSQSFPCFSLICRWKVLFLTSCTNNCRLLVQHCVISWSLVPSKRQMWGYARWTYAPRKTRSESNNCELLCKRSTSNRIRTQTHIYAIRNRITFLYSVFWKWTTKFSSKWW